MQAVVEANGQLAANESDSNGFRFYFYSHEPNEPPHVHIDQGEATIKIWLGSLEVAKSRGFRAHEISGIIAMTAEHRAMFVEKWHEYFG